MNEKESRVLIKNAVQEMSALCLELINEFDEIDLNEIDRQLDKIVGKYGLAKKWLLECADY